MKLLDPISFLGKFSLTSFPALPLRLICLLVLQNLTLTLVYYLQEEVLHQTHRLLVLLLALHANKLIIARAHSLQLLLERFRILEYILYFDQAFLRIVLANAHISREHTTHSDLVLRVHLEVINSSLRLRLLVVRRGANRDPLVAFQVLLTHGVLVQN